MMPAGRASRLRVPGEQVDEALRCVLADAQVEEVVGGQAAIAATGAETDDHLSGPWPAPDRPGPAARWRWQLYTPELTLEIMTGVLRAAVTGCQDLVRENSARCHGPAPRPFSHAISSA